MFHSVPSALTSGVGLVGVAVYLTAYVLMQTGYLRGQSYPYCSMVIVAASCVMISLTTAFNMSSLVIQVSYITISLVGMIRLFLIGRGVRFTAEEQAFVTRHLPLLKPHLARRLMNCGHWKDVAAGETLVVEGESIGRLHHIAAGRVGVSMQGRFLGPCGPGAFVGELTFLEGNPATATVTTLEPCRCFSLDRQAVAPLLRSNAEIQMALVASFYGSARERLLQRNREMLDLDLVAV